VDAGVDQRKTDNDAQNVAMDENSRKADQDQAKSRDQQYLRNR
jgi:hypothetical protein